MIYHAMLWTAVATTVATPIVGAYTNGSAWNDRGIRVSEVAIAEGKSSGENCDFCTNHWFYAEHRHRASGSEEDYRYNNQNHPAGDYFPYDCDVEHAICEPEHDVLWESAQLLDQVAAASETETDDVASVLEHAEADGVRARHTSVGVELQIVCGRTNRTLSITVPLPQSLSGENMARQIED